MGTKQNVQHYFLFCKNFLTPSKDTTSSPTRAFHKRCDINLFTSSTINQYVGYVCEHVCIVFAPFVCLVLVCNVFVCSEIKIIV